MGMTECASLLCVTTHDYHTYYSGNHDLVQFPIGFGSTLGVPSPQPSDICKASLSCCSENVRGLLHCHNNCTMISKIKATACSMIL